MTDLRRIARENEIKLLKRKITLSLIISDLNKLKYQEFNPFELDKQTDLYKELDELSLKIERLIKEL